MKVKRVRIGIKSIEDVLDDAKEVMKRLERGEKVKKESGVYFTSFESFRKALTPKRLELLHIIRTKKPLSLHHLARLADRDIKNVAEDVKHLEQIGLVEKQETSTVARPFCNYDKIDLEIAV